jgi:adenosylmethionine-8-amino-7-oxononanoate aminotransferase
MPPPSFLSQLILRVRSVSPALAVGSAKQSHSLNVLKESKTLKPTSILHRTPWQPPVALAAEGIYIDLEDGRRVIDGVGGAAVACLGNSHPTVMQAIKDQVDKVSCMDQFNPRSALSLLKKKKSA